MITRDLISLIVSIAGLTATFFLFYTMVRRVQNRPPVRAALFRDPREIYPEVLTTRPESIRILGMNLRGPLEELDRNYEDVKNAQIRLLALNPNSAAASVIYASRRYVSTVPLNGRRPLDEADLHAFREAQGRYRNMEIRLYDHPPPAAFLLTDRILAFSSLTVAQPRVLSSYYPKYYILVSSGDETSQDVIASFHNLFEWEWSHAIPLEEATDPLT